MQAHQKVKYTLFLNLFIGLFLYCFANISFANVVISGNTAVTSPTTYNNEVIDMAAGRFSISGSGSLDIENSVINVTISPSNPFFVTLTQGNLKLKNNTFHVTVSGISPTPNNKAGFNLMHVQQGEVNIDSNTFTADTAFTVGLFETENLLTNEFVITNNTINHFHGGIYLTHSNNAVVNDNTFNMVSFANIYNDGNLSEFKRNSFSFPGSLSVGDAIDLVDSDGITISDNVIASAAGYGITITGCQNIFIDNNKITDGATYGIFIQTPSLTNIKKHRYLTQFFDKKKLIVIPNNNIIITNNYLAQNRYGLAGEVVDKLIVTNNIFIQRFNDSSVRQFWTNNDILLPNASNMTWLNNIYKEAFTQEVPGDNSLALHFVTFPDHGGVFLP